MTTGILLLSKESRLKKSKGYIGCNAEQSKAMRRLLIGALSTRDDNKIFLLNLRISHKKKEFLSCWELFGNLIFFTKKNFSVSLRYVINNIFTLFTLLFFALQSML